MVNEQRRRYVNESGRSRVITSHRRQNMPTRNACVRIVRLYVLHTCFVGIMRRRRRSATMRWPMAGATHCSIRHMNGCLAGFISNTLLTMPLVFFFAFVFHFIQFLKLIYSRYEFSTIWDIMGCMIVIILFNFMNFTYKKTIIGFIIIIYFFPFVSSNKSNVGYASKRK